MMKMKSVVFVCASMVAVALGCGGGGIDRSKTLGSLSTADQMAECNHLASELPQKTIDCGMGATFEIGVDPSKCTGSNFETISSTCTVTVGQLEDCLTAIYDEGSAACTSQTEPAVCQPLESAGSACDSGM